MIKCEKKDNKTSLAIYGIEPVVILECAELLRAIRIALEKNNSKEFVKKMLDDVYESIWMSEEEITENVKKNKKEKPICAEMADLLFENLFGGATLALTAQRRMNRCTF